MSLPIEMTDFNPVSFEYGASLFSDFPKNIQVREALNKKVQRLALFVLLGTLAGAFIGSLFGGGIGAVVGGAIGGSFSLILGAAYEGIQSACTKRRRSHYWSRLLPMEAEGANKEGQAQLGQFYPTDVVLSTSAEESFQWKKDLISSAEQSIELSPNFAGGRPFRQTLMLIAERLAAKPELKAHLLLSKDLLEQMDLKFLEVLSKKYPQRFVYLISDRLMIWDQNGVHSEENHAKLLVVDGKYAMTGGTGIHKRMNRSTCAQEEFDFNETMGARCLDPAFCDTDIAISGKPVLAARRQFFRLFQQWEQRMGQTHGDKPSRFYALAQGKAGICPQFETAPHLVKGARVKLLVSGPEHGRLNPISREICTLIRQSKSTIQIAQPYLDPVNKIKHALRCKREAGVEITAIFNGTHNTHRHYTFSFATRKNYNLFDKAYEYRGENQLYHKKVGIFDKKVSCIGSYNFGEKSAAYDSEVLCVIESPEVAAQLERSLQKDKAQSYELKGQALKRKATLLEKFFTAIMGPILG